MKPLFHTKTLIVLVVAIAAVAANVGQAQDPLVPMPASGRVLPANIPPGSPVGQVVKLVQAGVDVGVIQAYIANCPSLFNLSADEIVALSDLGVTTDMVNAMFAHDKALAPVATVSATSVTPVPPPYSPPPAPVVSSDLPLPPAAPPTDISMDEINQNLTPYGSWVVVDGYGTCWRPAVVVYDSTWRPYCDRGHWVYTDCGWYWDSDYAWGITFHYGRWFNHPRYGWCWWPNTVWGPSWVTWRSSPDYCGWAPLPPYTVYQPGIGFAYRGNNVSVSFDFGLAASCFTFVAVGHVCEPQPRYYCVPQQQVTVVYNQTTIINNYSHNNRTIVNNGISVAAVGNAAHRSIQPVAVGTVINNRGLRNSNYGGGQPVRRYGANSSDAAAQRNYSNLEVHQDVRPVTAAPAVHQTYQPAQPAVPVRPQTAGTPANGYVYRQPGQTFGQPNVAPNANDGQPHLTAPHYVETTPARQMVAEPRPVAPTAPAKSAPAPAPQTTPIGGNSSNSTQGSGYRNH